MKKFTLPIIGFCAYSGTGKTTLLTRLIPCLKQRNLKIGVIKHAHHTFDTDQPAKDSYKLRKAGATQMLVSSSNRNVLITEIESTEDEPKLSDLVKRLDASQLDLILVEGFKHENFPKIELHRSALDKPLMYPNDKNIIALASDKLPLPKIDIPVLDLNNVNTITDFIVRYNM